MRRLFLLALLLGLAQPAWAVPALVRRCPSSATMNGGNNGTPVTCAFTSNAAGNMLFIFAYVDVNSSALTITDTVGNTWTTVQADTAGVSPAGTTHAWAAYNNLVSAGTNTVSVASSVTPSNSFYIGGAEYSGLATSAALDQTRTNQGTSTACGSLTVTTTVASELFTGVLIGGDGAATVTAGTNIAWVLEQSTITGNRSPAWEDFIASTTQTVSADFTYSTSQGCRATIFTFKTPAAGGGSAKKKRPGIFF